MREGRTPQAVIMPACYNLSVCGHNFFSMRRPRESLEGIELPEGWLVTKRLDKQGKGSGGIFSSGYEVQDSNGRAAFLKAIDFYEAGFALDPARALQPLIEQFNFERDLLEMCQGKSFDRVVTYINDGKIMINGHAVQYLIFELADRDIRGQIDLLGRVELAWQLRSLQQMATGLKQLHSVRIAHQDLKPSNVLVFASEIKIGDLGRASHPAYNPPHEQDELPGDRSYSPPELLYRHRLPDANKRRLLADLYLLGSMIVFMFTRASMTALILRELEQFHHWKIWRGSYEEILPFVRDGFGRALVKISAEIPSEIRSEIMLMIRQLCEPDPALRGHPRNKAVPYELERYVTRLDVLARKAKLKLF